MGKVTGVVECWNIKETVQQNFIEINTHPITDIKINNKQNTILILDELGSVVLYDIAL